MIIVGMIHTMSNVLLLYVYIYLPLCLIDVFICLRCCLEIITYIVLILFNECIYLFGDL